MRDMFGQDTATISEGAPTPPPVVNLPALAATPNLGTGPVAASPLGAPTLQQAVDKAVAKAGADAVVATDPNAVHAVKMSATAPPVLTATAAGAGIGLLVGGPPGAALGAGVGWVVERYQIGGGPIRKLWVKVRTWHHKATQPAGAAPAAAPPAGQ